MIVSGPIPPVNAAIGFRLLNSEIGNDRKGIMIPLFALTGFRLLNSEIGNDQEFKNIRRWN